MRIKKELQKIIEEQDLYITDNVIGNIPNENYKYLIYYNSNFNFKAGANTQDEAIEILKK